MCICVYVGVYIDMYVYIYYSIYIKFCNMQTIVWKKTETKTKKEN